MCATGAVEGFVCFVDVATELLVARVFHLTRSHAITLNRNLWQGVGRQSPQTPIQ